MNVFDYAYALLSSKDIEGKLLSCEIVEDFSIGLHTSQITFKRPGRAANIIFSEKQKKFPNIEKLKTDEGKAIALHFFANHELLAIEMMAQAILRFTQMSDKERQTILLTISDEQKHFRIYCERLEELGFLFGDFPVNAFFWKQMDSIDSLDQFYAVVALTFEQANLDFADYYYHLFLELGDDKTASVMKIVYDDEIKHVARGRQYLQKKLKENTDLWDYYCDLLPYPITPSRAKGILFKEKGRLKAGLPEAYVDKLASYSNSFKVTQRKKW